MKEGKLPKYIRRAIRCGPMPVIEDWRPIFNGEREGPLTKAQTVMAFAETHLVVPDGLKAGQPLRLELFQEVFITAIFDNPALTSDAILSVARRNGKSFLIAIIVMAFLVGPLAVPYSVIASAANSREQAGLIFKMMSNMIYMSPELQAVTKIVPSTKKITGLAANVEYYAMSAEAKTGHGQSLLVVVLDEAGQVVGPTNDYIEMLQTSQGSHLHPLFITISTQSPSDADFLSITIDDATEDQTPTTVCHVYETPKAIEMRDIEMSDEAYWKWSNPGLDIFRGRADLRKKIQQAERLPAKEGATRNLNLNQRVTSNTLWLSPSVWKQGNRPIDINVFLENPVSVGIDLSQRHDLTAAVLSAHDPETDLVHVLPIVVCPGEGILERGKRDRVPYDTWVKNGQMFTCGNKVIDYDEFAELLRDMLDDLGIEATTIEFDRWRINEFKSACERVGFAPFAEWNEVGQGYKDMSPRCEAFVTVLMDDRMCHGGHPLLNMAASNAIAVRDPAGSTKLDKTKATQKIDPIVAALMAVYPVSEGSEGGFDAEAMIG